MRAPRRVARCPCAARQYKDVEERQPQSGCAPALLVLLRVMLGVYMTLWKRWVCACAVALCGGVYYSPWHGSDGLAVRILVVRAVAICVCACIGGQTHSTQFVLCVHV
jgi:hypothetical protein